MRELGPKPREPLLELGAGTGEAGFEAAATLGDSGRLIPTDFPPRWSRSRAAAGPNVGSRMVWMGLRTGDRV